MGIKDNFATLILEQWIDAHSVNDENKLEELERDVARDLLLPGPGLLPRPGTWSVILRLLRSSSIWNSEVEEEMVKWLLDMTELDDEWKRLITERHEATGSTAGPTSANVSGTGQGVPSALMQESKELERSPADRGFRRWDRTKISLPEYKGEPGKFRRWWNRTVEALKLSKIDEAEHLLFMQNGLKGEALEEFWQILERRGGASTATADEVAKDLAQVYDRLTIRELREKLEWIKQIRGESAMNFRSRWNELMLDFSSLKKPIPEEDQIDMVLVRLLDEERLEVVPYETVELLFAAAHRIDRSHKRGTGKAKKGQALVINRTTGGKRSRKTVDVSRITCFHCEKKGHYKVNCPQLQRSARTTAEQKEEHKPAQGHTLVCDDEAGSRQLASVKTKLLGTTRQAVIDTASTHTLINERLARWCGLQLSQGAPIEVSLGDSTKMSLTEITNVSFSLNGKKFIREAYLADIPCEFLLGMDFLHEEKAVIDLHRGSLTLSGGTPLTVPLQWEFIDASTLVMNLCRTASRETKRETARQKQWTLDELLAKHQHLFGDPETLKVPAVEFELKEDFNRPFIHIPPRRHSPEDELAIEREVEEMLRLGIIENSRDPWNFPLVVAHQKNKDRVCVDFRQLNQALKDYEFPLPTIPQLLEYVRGARWMTLLDMSRSFQQLEVGQESRKMLSFTTRSGKYRYKRMPYGIAVAPAKMQEQMTSSLVELLWMHCLVYIDDVLIYSFKNETDHLRILDQVFTILGDLNVRLNKKKCSFMVTSADYLGFRVTREGIRPCPDKVAAIRALKEPTNKTDLLRFLGAVGFYRRFVRNLSTLAAPLYELTGTNPFEWTEPRRKAWQDCRDAIHSNSLNAWFSPDKPLVLYLDASQYAVAAVVVQEERLVAVESKTLTPPQTRYSATEREMLALRFALLKFRKFIGLSRFTCYTDHQPLLGIVKKLDCPNRRLQLFLTDISEFLPRMDLRYLKGKENVLADLFSRDVDESVKSGPTTTISMAMIKNRQSGVENELKSIDTEQVDSLLWEVHDENLHCGERRMLKLLKSYTWPGKTKDIQDFLSRCSCANQKDYRPSKREPEQWRQECRAHDPWR